MKQFSFLLLALLATGCMLIKPLGQFSVEPYAKPLEQKLSVPLSIVLMDDVKNDFTVTGAGVKPMEVSAFRNSIQGGLKAVFERNVTTVTFPSMKPEDGLVLVVYRIRPYWKRTGGTTQVMGMGTTVQSVQIPFIKSTFQYESSLYYQNRKLSSADGEVTSEGIFSDIYQAQPVFKDGMKVLCETLNRAVLAEDNVKRLP